MSWSRVCGTRVCWRAKRSTPGLEGTPSPEPSSPCLVIRLRGGKASSAVLCCVIAVSFVFLRRTVLRYCLSQTDRQDVFWHLPQVTHVEFCLLYTSDAADDLLCVDLGGRRIIK